MSKKKKKERIFKEDIISRLTNRQQHVLALAILFILPVILFSSTVLGDKKFMGHDTIQWRAGAESVMDYKEQHDGEEPLWATNMFGGMPAYTVNAIKSVPHLDNKVFNQLRFIWPAAQYWVLLGGIFFFFILQGYRPLNAALGSVLIGFTTYIPIIIGAGHNIKFIAYAYIPWMLCGYWLLTRTDKRWWGFFLFAVASTLEFRAGHPQVTYYFIYLFAGLFFYDTWRYYAKQKIVDWGKITGFITAAIILALLGTAQQYWQLMEYSPHSIRGGSAIADITSGSGLSLEYAFGWSQGIMETFTLLIPNLYGGESGLAYWGEKPGTSGPHYLGAVAFLLFMIGIFRSRNQIKYVFLAVGILTMTFSWGYHFPLNEVWFNILPVFNKFRTPEMWLIVTVFCFSVISVFGLQSIFELYKEGKPGLQKMYLPLGIAMGIGVIFLLFSSSMFSFENDREQQMIAQQIAQQNNISADHPQVQQRASQYIEVQLKPERIDLARFDILRYLAIAGLSIALIVLFYKQKIGVGYFLLSLLFLSAFDMLTAGNRYINENALTDRQNTPADIIEQQRRPVDEFIQTNIHDPEGYPYRAFPLDDNPFNNAIPSYFYPTIGGYSGAKLSIVQDVMDNGLFTGPGGLNYEVLNMLNVKFISAQRELPLQGYSQVFSQDNVYVYENENVLPKAWFADEVITTESPREAFNLILPESNFSPRTTAVVESANEITVHPDTTASVNVEQYTARRLTFSIQRGEPGFLVLSEIFYPEGWTTLLNGKEIQMYKTNYLLRGFEIPAGEHTLELSFDPDSYIWGGRISWAANLIQWFIGLALLAGWVRSRKNRYEA